MNTNLNQTLISLCDAYHAGKLTTDEYRVQRTIELERLSQQADKLVRESSVGSEKWKTHSRKSAVLFVIFISIAVAALMLA